MYDRWSEGAHIKKVPIDSADLKEFRPSVERTQTTGKKFNNVPVQGKKLLTLTLLWHLVVMTEKSYNLAEWRVDLQLTSSANLDKHLPK